MSWSRVNCLLRQYIDRKMSIIPSEHGLILEALDRGADPNTIVQFVTTSARYLRMDDELAGTAIGLCIERHYNARTLKFLLEHCRENTTVIVDIVQKAIKAHYSMGCYPLREGMVPFGKRVIDWAKKQKRGRNRRSSGFGRRRSSTSRRVSFVVGDADDKEIDDDHKKKMDRNGGFVQRLVGNLESSSLLLWIRQRLRIESEPKNIPFTSRGTIGSNGATFSHPSTFDHLP